MRQAASSERESDGSPNGGRGSGNALSPATNGRALALGIEGSNRLPAALLFAALAMIAARCPASVSEKAMQAWWSL